MPGRSATIPRLLLKRGVYLLFLLLFLGIVDKVYGSYLGVTFNPYDLRGMDEPPEFMRWPIPYQVRTSQQGSLLLPPHQIVLNSEGVRGSNFTLQKLPTTQRILVLGDSFTFNEALRLEETYPALLAGLLQDRTGTPVDVLNYGVNGYNTRMEVEFFKARGLKYRPDLVVLQVFENDWESSWDSYRNEEPTARYYLAFLVNQFAYHGLQGKSHLLNHLNYLLITRMVTHRLLEEQQALGPEGVWNRIREPFQELKRLADEQQFTLVVFSAGDNLYRTREDWSFDFPLNDLLKDFALQEGMIFVEMSPVLARYPLEQTKLSVTYDAHWSPFANRIVAEELADTLLRFGLVGADSSG